MGLFDGIQSALSSAYKAVTSAAGNVYSAATSAASSAARAVSSGASAAASYAPRISLPSVPSYSPPQFTFSYGGDLSKITKQALDNLESAARATFNATQAAAEAAQDAARNAANQAANTAAAASTAANQTAAAIVQAAPKIVVPTFQAPDAAQVAREIAATVTAAPAAAAAAAGGVIKATTAAIPKISLPTIAAPALALPVSIALPSIPNLSGSVNTVPGSILPSVTLPGITGPGSVIPNASNGANLIDQIIQGRNNTYDFGGEMFAKGWEGNDAIGAATGAGIYATTAAIDLLAPADALNLGNKIATGRMNEISSDEWIAGGIDVAMIGVGLGTGGAGYVGARSLLKGGNIALAAGKAGAKLSEKVAKTKAVKEAATIGAMAAISAAGGKMIKLGKVTKLIKPEVKTAAKKVVKASSSASAQAATAAKKAAAAANAAAAAKRAQSAANAAAAAKKAQAAASAAASAKRAQAAAEAAAGAKRARTAAEAATAAKKAKAAAAAPAPRTIAKTITKETAAAPSSSLLKTEKAIANDASALKTVEKDAVKELGAVETAAKPGSSMVKYGAIALGAGLTGIGLASYLGGSGADQVPTDPTLPTDPTVPDPGIVNPDVPNPYIDPNAGGLTPDDYTAQMDALDQALADGTITQDQYDQAVGDLQQQQDDAGGNFPAAIGSDTPYQSVEDAAQDATRAIPGDPLAWFRENGLAAPVMGGLIIAALLLIWWIWKRFTKKGGKGAGKHRSGSKSSTPASGSSSGNKIVVV